MTFMLGRLALNPPAFFSRRNTALLLFILLLLAAPLWAQTELPRAPAGAGSGSSSDHNPPDSETPTDKFLLNSARLYVNGPVNDKIKFMFNTEYDGGTNKVGVLDVIGRFEYS